MGNCIDILISPCVPPQEKIRVLTFNGGQEEFMPSTPVKQVTSGAYHGYNLVHPAQPHLPLPPETKLVSGEVYYLLPHPCIPPVSMKMVVEEELEDDHDVGRGGGGGVARTFKVVVTKKQLKQLLFNNGLMQECPVNEDVFDMCRKWRPSLATIPEL
ncbi:hypothetical protein Scep_028966 [Stephania cephalantha]|uniref:Uncharacterized protein n=1 Tax=Stephania cephalantha TaxID=152367 RepID=A0AAP0EAY9_9MAGN